MKPLIIGLGHKARQGKNVAAEAITNFYARQRIVDREFYAGKLLGNIPFVQSIAFAESLYEICRKEYGMTEKDGKLLQDVGNLKRQEDPEYWLKRAWAKFSPTANIILLTDLRYKNEADAIVAQGGSIVDVQRFKNGKRVIADDRPADHISEIELDGYPAFILSNTDGHEALFAEQAITLAEYLWGMHAG